MPHQTSWETVSNVNINEDTYEGFDALMQIPIDFTVKGETKKIVATELQGKTTPNWKLKKVDGDSVSLSDVKSKILLIQFTGVGCGPCHASIPFLKNLVTANHGKDFELISIETWSKNLSGLSRYKGKNKLNYRFLVCDDQMKGQYKIFGVPAFFILDENRMIKKVIVGYTKGATDDEISRIIDDLQ